MHRRVRTGAIALAALATVGGPTAAALAANAGPHASAAAASHTITLKNIAFNPRKLTIHRGDKVTWVWRDKVVPHNVTFKAFHSRTQQTGSYSVRFTKKGTYTYHCTIHLGMTGTIVVK